MYLQHFGLKHAPLDKNPKTLIPSTQQDDLQKKLNWLLEAKGIASLTGDAGTGKTTALRQWCESLNSLSHHVIYQSDNHFRAFDIYGQLADSLGMDRLHRYSLLWRKLKQVLIDMYDNKQMTPIWILDEAHLLPSKFLLELPSFLNFSFDTRNILVIVLVGLPSLNAIINRPFYSALNSRMLFQYRWQGIDELEPFTHFIQQAFEAAGKTEKILTNSGMQLIHMASKGRLRYAQRIITHALHLAASCNLNHLPDEIIHQTIEELQS